MKKTKLEHSFDDIKLSDVDKKKILDQLNNKSQRKPRQAPLRPALALALIALLIAGTYFGGKYINPRQIAGTVPTTSAQTDTDTKLLFTTPYSVLSKLYTREDFPVSTDQWTEIAKILNQAVPDPLDTAMTMDLRENDLEFVGDVMQGVYTIMIRDFRQVYRMASGSFSAYHLKDEDSKALKTLLTEVLSGSSRPQPVFSDSYNTLRKLSTRVEYPVTTQEWLSISKLLNQVVPYPQITEFTDDLISDDELEMIGKNGNRVIIKDFREVYLSGQDGSFSAYQLEAEKSQELRTLLTKILNKDPVTPSQIISNILEADESAQSFQKYPGEQISATFKGLDLANLKSLANAKLTYTGKAETLPLGIIILEAWRNAFGVFDGQLYVRTDNGISIYSPDLPNKSIEEMQRKLSEQYDNLLKIQELAISVSPQELHYTEFQAPLDKVAIPLSPEYQDDLNNIFKDARYVDSLNYFEPSFPDTTKFSTSEADKMTFFIPSGDLYVFRNAESNILKSVYHFKLPPDMALKLNELLGLIRESK